MIEDFKTILDMIAKLPNFAIEVLLGFGIYKLVVYLSTTGSVVFISRMLIEKIHDAYTKPKPPQETIFKFEDIYMCGTSEKDIQDILTDLARNGTSANMHTGEVYSGSYSRSQYIYSQDTKWLKDAVMEHVAKVGYPGANKK